MRKFIDKAGSKRKGIMVTCQYCHKEFISRQDQKRKYCSKECYKAHRNAKNLERKNTHAKGG